MRFLGKLVVNTVAIILAAYLLPGISNPEPLIAFLLALLLALLNVTLKPLLIILTIPITIFTLGLFLLAINAIIILIADYILGSAFEVNGFWWALLFSIVMSIINSVLEYFITPAPRQQDQQF